MTTITTTDVTNGTLTDATVMNANFGAIKTVVNGNIDNANIASNAAIALTKLAQTGATSNQAVVWNGSAWAPATITTSNVYDRVTTPVDVANTVTETTVYSKSITGNDLSTNKIFRVTLTGDFLCNNSGTDSLTFRIKFGGSTLVTSAALRPGLGATSATRGGFEQELKLQMLGTSNSQRLSLVTFIQRGNNDSENAGSNNAMVGNDGTIDTTTAQTLSLTVQWSAASANNSWRTKAMVAELV